MKIVCKLAVSSFALFVMSGCATKTQSSNPTPDRRDQDPQLKEHTLPAAEQNARVQNGKRVYQGTCIACHGDDGRGALPGVPDLTRMEGFESTSHSDFALFKHVEHVEDGVKKPGDPMAMPPKGGNPALTEEDIRDALIYMRAKFLSES
jgi:cytochrome c5